MMKVTRKEVAKKINKEDEEKQLRIKTTIEAIQAACKENSTAIQPFMYEAKTPDGLTIGIVPQIRIVLNDKEEVAKELEPNDKAE